MKCLCTVTDGAATWVGDGVRTQSCWTRLLHTVHWTTLQVSKHDMLSTEINQWECDCECMFLIPGRYIQSRGSLGQGSTGHWWGQQCYRNSLSKKDHGNDEWRRNKPGMWEESDFDILRTFAFSTALSGWFIRVAAISITGEPGADDIPSVTITHTTCVIVISKLSAVGIFFTMKHAACKR